LTGKPAGGQSLCAFSAGNTGSGEMFSVKKNNEKALTGGQVFINF